MHSIMKAHAGTPCERKSRFTFSAFRADKSAALASEQPAFRVIAQELHRLQAKLACHHGHTAFSEEKFHFRGPRAFSIEIRVPVKARNRVRQKRVAPIFSSYVPASTFNDLSRVTKFESCLANHELVTLCLQAFKFASWTLSELQPPIFGDCGAANYCRLTIAAFRGALRVQVCYRKIACAVSVQPINRCGHRVKRNSSVLPTCHERSRLGPVD